MLLAQKIHTMLVIVCLMFTGVLFTGANISHAAKSVLSKKTVKEEPVAPVTPLAITEFAANATLATKNEGGQPNTQLQQGVLYKVTLPPFVQLETKFADGRDVAVFNAQGESLPFFIRLWTEKSLRKEHTFTQFYPLWGKEKSTTEDLVLSFTLDKDARIVPKVFDSSDAKKPDDQVLKGYIIPLESSGIEAQSISFEWENGVQPAVQFSLQTGSDLKNWYTITSQASLVRFTGPGGNLESSAIDLHNTHLQKYLRIVFEDGFAPTSISKAIIVEKNTEQQSKVIGPIAPQTSKQLANSEKVEPNTYIYSLPTAPTANGSLAVQRVSIHSPTPGLYANVAVFTRTDSKNNWTYYGTHTFYSIVKDGVTTQGPAILLQGAPLRQIKLVSANKAEQLPKELALTIEYTPADMYFLPAGNAPYSLAWHGDRAGALAKNKELYTMANEGEWQPAELVNLNTLEHATAQQVKTEPSVLANESWKQYGLWGILALGVIALGFMALQVGKSMKSAEQK